MGIIVEDIIVEDIAKDIIKDTAKEFISLIEGIEDIILIKEFNLRVSVKDNLVEDIVLMDIIN